MRDAGHGGSGLRAQTLHIVGNTRSVVESENVKNRLGVGKRLAFKNVWKRLTSSYLSVKVSISTIYLYVLFLNKSNNTK